MWERTLDIIGIILKVISMAEKIITEVGNNNEGSITIILGKSRKIKKILEKLEEAKK
ncbi:hypothetical protein ES705_44939 [subsurface metagenome]